MSKEKKLSLRLGLLAGITSLAMLGATAGSLAWYTYSRSVTFSFVGTTVASSSLLNIGLVDNGNYFDATDLQTYDLQEEEVTEGTETNRIVWSRSRSGFSLLALRYYLEKSPYAVDKLYPVTTKARTYDEASASALYRSPEYGETDFVNSADQNAYCVLPFAFRVIDESSSYVAGKNVWLTDATVGADHQAESSIRVYVDGANKFLMKPSDEENNVGSTKVGGLLDLIGDGLYDRDTVSNKEYCYGQFVNTPTYAETGYSGPNSLVNVNGVDDEATATTFLAKHNPGVLVPDIATATPRVQTHAGLGKVKPSTYPNGQFYVDTTNGNGIPVGTTSAGSKIAYTTLTIFVEGWDHSIIDQNAGYSFNLGLKFEFDRI